MRSLNRAMLLGELAEQPGELRQTPEGDPALRVTLITRENRIVSGVKEAVAVKHHLLFLRDDALAVQGLGKGSFVWVQGPLVTRDYQDRQGVKRRYTELVATRFIPCYPSPSLNRVILAGWCGGDPELKGGERKLVNLRFSTGEARDRDAATAAVQWHNTVWFGKSAEIAQRLLRKGAWLVLEGVLQTREYVSRGVEFEITEVVVRELILPPKAG